MLTVGSDVQQVFSKLSKSWVMRNVNEKKSRGYLKDILTTSNKNTLPKTEGIPANIAATEKPNNDEPILNTKTRFSKLHDSRKKEAKITA